MTVLPSSAADRFVIVSSLRAAGCVFAEDEADLLIAGATSATELADWVVRRSAGVPLEHVLGWAEFGGLRIRVGRGVFVPRRRTEFLVEQALALHLEPDVVVDLCCGSGALGRAIKEARPHAEVFAVDIDPTAVACAAANLAGLGTVLLGDLYEPLPGSIRGRVSLLVANVPYVPTGHLGLLPSEARLYEPRVALDGGIDGLDVLRRVAGQAPDWLGTGGHLLVEVSGRQVDPAKTAAVEAGLESWVVSSEALETSVLVARTLSAWCVLEAASGRRV